MASHAGLLMVVKSNKGYVRKDGTLTQDKTQARIIRGLEFGFKDASGVAKSLGCFEDLDFEFETLEPSYDSRLAMMESFFHDLGMDYRTAYSKAEYLFNAYHLYDYEKFKQYLSVVESETAQEISQGRAKEVAELDGRSVVLYGIKKSPSVNEEYTEETLYSTQKRYTKYTFNLPTPDVEKYFVLNNKEKEYYNSWQIEGLDEYLRERFNNENAIKQIRINDNNLEIYIEGKNYRLIEKISNAIRSYLSQKEMHITRMFGSYILLMKIDGKLQATLATEIPIKYCPLMIKLLEEVGGETALSLINSLKTTDPEKQKELMCKLINEVVINGGYFDTNRSLNSCEANVLFGASETISSAFQSNLLDAAVIVSNNLGTIITTNAPSTQGAVKRMTGLFYTSPNENLVKEAKREGIIPVFPYSAKIDQLAGVKLAIKKGYKRIAVSVAAHDNYLHEELKRLEAEHNVTIYKFGLCSTGINKSTAEIMRDNADVIWSCASKYVKEEIEPSSLLQVGIKIPVHIMTNNGWKIVLNHLKCMDSEFNENIELTERPVILNDKGHMKVLKRSDVRKCSDCPHPCV